MLKDLQERVTGQKEDEVVSVASHIIPTPLQDLITGLRRRLLRKPSSTVNLTVGQIMEKAAGGVAELLPLPRDRVDEVHGLDPALHHVVDLPTLSSQHIGWCARYVSSDLKAQDHRKRWPRGRVQCDLVKYAHDYEATLGTNPYSGKPMFPSRDV
jgi:hypothetical protein